MLSLSIIVALWNSSAMANFYRFIPSLRNIEIGKKKKKWHDKINHKTINFITGPFTGRPVRDISLGNIVQYSTALTQEIRKNKNGLFFSTFLTSEAVLALLHKQWGLVPVMAVRCPACVSLITLVSSGPTEIWCGGKSILDNNEKFILLFLSPPHPSLSRFLSLHPPLTHSYPALSYSVIYLNVNNHSFLTPYLPSPKFNRKSI